MASTTGAGILNQSLGLMASRSFFLANIDKSITPNSLGLVTKEKFEIKVRSDELKCEMLEKLPKMISIIRQSQFSQIRQLKIKDCPNAKKHAILSKISCAFHKFSVIIPLNRRWFFVENNANILTRSDLPIIAVLVIDQGWASPFGWGIWLVDHSPTLTQLLPGRCLACGHRASSRAWRLAIHLRLLLGCCWGLIWGVYIVDWNLATALFSFILDCMRWGGCERSCSHDGRAFLALFWGFRASARGCQRSLAWSRVSQDRLRLIATGMTFIFVTSSALLFHLWIRKQKGLESSSYKSWSLKYKPRLNNCWNSKMFKKIQHWLTIFFMVIRVQITTRS